MEQITKAVRLVNKGAKLIGTNFDLTGPTEIGDRMDTDIIAGIETGLDTALVLSGVTSREGCEQYPYRPRLILNGVGDIPE